MLTKQLVAAGLALGAGAQLSPSRVNSYRITAVAERLAMHVQPGNRGHGIEFFNLCLSLSRGIDYALANNEIPEKAQELPVLLKQICHRKGDLFLQSSIMVLMVSVKHACNLGWFQKKDSEELLAFCDEIVKSYCSTVNADVGPSYGPSTLLTIMGRFYPKLKMGHTLASLEVKPGYGAFATDFHISKNTAHSPHDKICLLVAQTDNIETSACLITPQQASFLLNGKGVDRRTNVIMDPGPQMPTNVTGMLKYGTNLLQAVGQFNAHYLILVAFMRMTSLDENLVIQDYVQPAATSQNSDSDIIEGPSQISLNCPISFTRIKTPVKGRSCKHYQCFDFSNFIEINSRRPSWRCPHCNQCVCYSDIRLDQNMVEVLKNVGDNVVEVVINADGSWKPVLEDGDNVNKNQNDGHSSGKEQSEPKEPSCSSGPLSDVLDLTNDDDMEIVNVYEDDDRKPLVADFNSQSINPTITSSGMNSAVASQNLAAQVEDDFWSGLLLDTDRLDTPTIVGTSEHPVLTDAVSPAINQEAEGHGNTVTPNSVMQNQLSAPNHFLSQQPNYMNSISSDYGRSQTIPRHVNRTPIAIQALPAQSQALGPQQRSRTNLNPLIPNSSTSTPFVSVSSSSNGFGAILSDTERQQHFSRPTMNLSPVMGASPSGSQRPVIQNRTAPHTGSGSASSQLPNPYGAGFLSGLRNPHLQQIFNPRASQPNSPSSAVPSSRSHIQQGGSHSGIVGQAARPSANSQPVMAMPASRLARQSPSVPVQNQTSRAAPSVPVQNQTSRAAPSLASNSIQGSAGDQSGLDGSFNSQSEPNWQPTGRMRGSLSGRPYSDIVRQLIIEPTQSVQSARPQGQQPVRPSNASHFNL